MKQGKDYYIEQGKWVFTAHFLAKRGFCCSSGCRHCPYSKKEQQADKEAKRSEKQGESKEKR